MFSARVIAHSIYDGGPEIMTIEATVPHSLLSEIAAHRVLSKTVHGWPPFKDVARQVAEDPAVPAEIEAANEGQWLMAANSAAENAYAMELAQDPSDYLLNRILEPFTWHQLVITGTAWQNFFRQWRTSSHRAEMALIAQKIGSLLQESVPDRLQPGEWHSPYVDAKVVMEIVDKVHTEAHEQGESNQSVLDTRVRTMIAKVSAVRCARPTPTSDLDSDLSLYQELINQLHWSPLEHVATPWAANRQSNREGLSYRTVDDEGIQTPQVEHLPRIGNLLGWRSLRVEAEAVRGLVTYQ